MDESEVPLEPQSREELAARLETAVLSPTATDEDVARVCREAAGLGIASVIVRPDDIDLAAGQLKGSATAAGSVSGYPHGWQTTSVKLYEIRDMLRRGAKEIVAVAPVGRLISRQFQSVETEVLQMARSCREEGARFRLVLDPSLPEDLKVIGMKIAKRCEADFIQAGLEPSEAVWETVPQYKEVLKWFCGVAAPAPDRSLETALRLYRLDVQRILCDGPAAVLAAWSAALEARKAESPSG